MGAMQAHTPAHMQINLVEQKIALADKFHPLHTADVKQDIVFQVNLLC